MTVLFLKYFIYLLLFFNYFPNYKRKPRLQPDKQYTSQKKKKEKKNNVHEADYIKWNTYILQFPCWS